MLRRIALIVGMLTLLLASPASAGAGGGCHAPNTDAGGATVEMSQICFSPTVLRVAQGDTVTWENVDDVDHNVYSSAMPDYGTQTLRRGMSASVTFNDPGVFPYVCIFHPGMVGAVVVGDADTPPPIEAATPAAVETAASDPKAESPASDSPLEQRLAAVEASLLATPSGLPAGQPSWPAATIGLVAGLALGILGSRIRLSR